VSIVVAWIVCNVDRLQCIRSSEECRLQKEFLDLCKVFTDISRLLGRVSLTLCLTIAQILRSGPVNPPKERRCICRESQLLIRTKVNLPLTREPRAVLQRQDLKARPGRTQSKMDHPDRRESILRNRLYCQLQLTQQNRRPQMANTLPLSA
jgi:hypothetical protein